MNRGSPEHHDPIASLQRGFNEAPIHESGKYRPAAGSNHDARRFNEAPIHESGK